jgi:hypothetical protein
VTTPATATQAEIERRARGCLAALRKAGVAVGKVAVLPDGTVEVYASSAAGDSPPANPLDRLLPGGAAAG